MYVCMYVCVCVCARVCVYVCMYVQICFGESTHPRLFKFLKAHNNVTLKL
jgi:hypothetical protein